MNGQLALIVAWVKLYVNGDVNSNAKYTLKGYKRSSIAVDVVESTISEYLVTLTYVAMMLKTDHIYKHFQSLQSIYIILSVWSSYYDDHNHPVMFVKLPCL